MTTGVFHVPGPTGGGQYRHRPIHERVRDAQLQRDERLDEFADALAEEFTIGEAASLVGVSLRVGQRYYRQICERLGAARCE